VVILWQFNSNLRLRWELDHREQHPILIKPPLLLHRAMLVNINSPVVLLPLLLSLLMICPHPVTSYRKI
jgi:hypothetical protein